MTIRIARAAACAVVVAALVLAGTGCTSGLMGQTTRRSVLLYGDSLADESQRWFVTSFPPSIHVEVHVLGGTAICDFLPEMAGDVARTRPVAVVLEFAGNGLTRCTQPTPGQGADRQQLQDRYRQDAAAATKLLTDAGATVWWMGAPVNRDPTADIGNAEIRAVYAALPPRFARTHYVDAGRAVERDGQFVETLPCLREEPCAHINGTDNVVRSADGGHLCPQHTATVDTCPVWSSGAYRYGRAMAEPVLDALNLTPVQPRLP